MAHNGIDGGIKLRPNTKDLKEIGPTFKKRWEDFYLKSPDKPVMWAGILSAYTGMDPNVPRGKYFSIAYYTEYPISTGRVHIKAAQDPYAPPDFEPGFLNELAADLHVLRWTYKHMREIARRMKLYRGEIPSHHPHFPIGSAATTGKRIGPDAMNSVPIAYTDEDNKAIDDFHRRTVETTWHSLGACAMKPRERNGVVDSNLNVYGVQDLKHLGANTQHCSRYRYRPRLLDDLHYHQTLSARLKSLASSGDFPHMLFYGPSGAGKKTRITCTLRQLFGAGVEKLKIDQRVFLTPSKRKIEINLVQSNFHVEITPSEAGNFDRIVIQELLKEIAQTQQYEPINCPNKEPMSSHASGGTQSSRSMQTVMQHVSKRAGFDLPPEVADKIIDDSAGNLRKAILCLEALKMQSPDLTNSSLAIAKPDWESYCHKVADLILSEQTPARVMEVRQKFYELLSHCIPPTVILKTVADRVVEKVDEQIKADVIHWAAIYETRMRIGSKKIYHLEAWVIKVMSIYKHFFYDMDLSGFD
ncbi:dna replication factor c subunit [Moniliophthora roreri]|nr:dna replication factor c subunit [Moniliophthora roreri]